MTSHAHRRVGGDDGATLVLVLAFLAIFGLLISALLSQTDTSLKRTLTTRQLDQKVYAADAGIDAGIVALRNDPTLCSGPGRTGTLPSPSVNGHATTVSCTGLSGSSLGARGYALITTDPTTSSLTTQSGGTKKVEGSVYASGLSDSVDLAVDKGDVLEARSAGTCSGSTDKPGGLQVGPAPPYAYRCTTTSWTSLVDAPALPSSRPEDHLSAQPDLVVGSGASACYVFRPGTYWNGIVFGPRNYFASGTYYFPGGGATLPDGTTAPASAGELRLTSAALVAGAVSPGDAQINADGPCSGDGALAAVLPGSEPITGTGVTLVLGGDSRLVADNPGGQVEVHRRAGGGVEGVSVLAVPSGAPSPWNPSTLTLTQPLLQVGTGNTPSLSVHGMVYAPGKLMDFNATNDVKAQLVGGVVIGRFQLQTSASTSGVGIRLLSGGGRRRVTVVSTALGTGGSRDITSRAVVDIENDTARTASVVGWQNRAD